MSELICNKAFLIEILPEFEYIPSYVYDILYHDNQNIIYNVHGCNSFNVVHTEYYTEAGLWKKIHGFNKGKFGCGINIGKINGVNLHSFEYRTEECEEDVFLRLIKDWNYLNYLAWEWENYIRIIMRN